jgi:HK97 family phage major capsid protein
MTRTPLRVFKNQSGTPAPDVVTKALGTLTGEIAAFKGTMEEQSRAAIEAAELLARRLDRIEAKGNRLGDSPNAPLTLFKEMAGNKRVEEFRSGASRGVSWETPASLRLIRKTLLTSLQDPLAGSPSSSTFDVRPDRLPGVYNFPQRKLRLIDVLAHLPTTSNVVEYPQLSSDYTDAASVQGGEGVSKSEAQVDIGLASAKIATVAHHLPMSRQILDDVPLLSNFIERLLNYGVMLKLENLLLNGNGTTDKIAGLVPGSTVFAPTAGLKPADRIGEAGAFMETLGFTPDVVVFNSIDWFRIRAERDANQRYVALGWNVWPGLQTIFDMQPIPTPALALGTALVIDSAQVAVLDRMEVRSELGYVNTQFTSNAVTMLSELRAGLAIFATRGVQQVVLT